MKTSLQQLAAEINSRSRSFLEAKEQLQKKCMSATKEIGGLKCELLPDVAQGFSVKIADIEYDAEVFAHICNWFGKHYGQGDDTHETEPAADPE